MGAKIQLHHVANGIVKQIVQFHLNSKVCHFLIRLLQTVPHSTTKILAAHPEKAANDAATAFEKECVHFFSEAVQLFGVPRSVGQVYGLLFSSVSPLSFTDIVQRLNLSKGSVSQGLRALRDIGAIQPSEGGLGRRDHYVPELELRKLIAGFLRGSVEPHARSTAKRLQDYYSQHGSQLEAKPEQGRRLLARFEKLQSWNRKGAEIVPLIARFLA